jgi:hypothetical protein
LVTVAENVAVPFTPKRVGGVAPEGVGGGVVMLIAIGAGTICSVTLAVMEGSLAEIASIVTALPTGCSGGGV